MSNPHANHQGEPGDTGLERVRHLKRGTEYEVLGEAEGLQTDEYGEHHAHKLVVYRRLGGGPLRWMLPEAFRDGRFQTIASAPTPPDRVGEEVGRDWLDQPIGGELAFDGMRFGKGVPLRTVIKAAQRWRHDAVAAFNEKVEARRPAERDHVVSARLIPWEPGSVGGVDLTFESGLRVALPLSEPEATPQQSPSPTTETDPPMSVETKPCFWGGGNDILACSTCGLEYEYGKEDRPACPRFQAAGEVRHG